MKSLSGSVSTPASRNVFWDFVRGVAILLMLLGHAVQYGMGEEYLMSESYYANPLFKYIYGFHMPLFALVSGYFFWQSASRRSLPALLRKIAVQLFLPIVSFALIYYVVHYPLPSSFGNLAPYALGAVLHITKALWFLWAIMYSCLLLVLSRRVGLDSWWVQLLIVAVLYCLRDSAMTGGMKFLYPFFLLGYYARKLAAGSQIAVNTKPVGVGISRLVERAGGMGRLCWVVCIPSLLLYCVVMHYLYGYDTYFYTTQIYLFRTSAPLHQLVVDVVRLFAGLCGSVAIVAMLRLAYGAIANQLLAKAIAAVGRESKGVYCFQYLIVTDLTLTALLPWPWLSVGAFFVVLLVFSYAATLLVARIPWLRIIIGRSGPK